MGNVDPKFEGATEQELADYVASSHQRPGEADYVHEARCRAEEAELVAKLQARRAAQAAQAAEASVDEAASARADEEGERPDQGLPGEEPAQ